MALQPRTNKNSPMSTGGRKRLELALAESELRYRRLFETAQDGILILNADTGQIIDVNPYLLDLLGYPFETMIGQQLWEIGVFEDIAANRAAFAKLQTEEYIRYENRPLRTADGSQIEVEFVSNVYLVGDEKVIQCNIRDISVRSKAQEVECNERVNALQIAAKARDDVLAILSHELRTPLSAISSMIDLVELGDESARMLPQTPPAPPQLDRAAIAVVRRNVNSLVHLINELLDLGHFTKGSLPLDLRRVDAHEIIGFALKNLEPQQKTKEIALDLRLHAGSSHLMADAPKLERVISNLIGNALKFTPRGGTVSVVTRNEPNGDFSLEVHDSGIGISKDALARIFSPFEQADPSIHPRYGGLGLGLSIARTIVDLHGGSLEAFSAGIDQGSRFTVRLKGAAPAAALPRRHSATGFRILLAEDNDDARNCMVALLASAGYEVLAATDVKTGMELGRRNEIDLLIADLGLPDGSGAELLLKLRANAPGLPAIAISGYGLPEDSLNSHAVGFLLHLVKPVNFTELKGVIQSLAAAKASSLCNPWRG